MVRRAKPRPSTAVIQAEIDRVLPAYQTHLRGLGCSASQYSSLTRTARHMVAWLALNDMDVAALDIRQVQAFSAHDCDCPSALLSVFGPQHRWQADRFLDHLLESGRATTPSAIVTGGNLVASLTASLKAQGYRQSTLDQYTRTCRHFIVWLYLSDLKLGEFDGGTLQRFLAHDCTCAHPRFLSRPRGFSGSCGAADSLARFAAFLINRNVVADWCGPAGGASCDHPAGSQADWLRPRRPPPAGRWRRHQHVEAFVAWSRQHQGLRPTTLKNYERHVRALLPLLGDNPDDYDAGSVRRVILERARQRSPGQVSNEATALRSYLRFLCANQLCRAGLDRAVPPIRGRSVPQLPRFVAEQAVEAMIASCDGATPIGIRDRAILLLLARLALRAADITNLRLEDIDWPQAVLKVRGKARHSASLPLPQEVGDAIRAYILRTRPRVADTTVFLRVPAPQHALTSTGVGLIVRRAMKRASIDPAGLPAAHLFRHSRATNLLRGGASLEAVGALLRHKTVRSTAIYARVDVPMLLEIAQPWPEDLR